MVSLPLLAPSKVVSALVVLLGLADICTAAVQCDIIDDSSCGRRHQSHLLPVQVGSTYYADGFHGGTIYAKFESSVPSDSSQTRYRTLTYNFNLGDYDGTYWVILPSLFADADTCYAVYKNCDVVMTYFDTQNPLPNYYTLA
ncbi:hypothetical protein CORC01_13877 [Colletotrichum orchidophilum]|uniref:Uncharacterized protein n=1 Tax=Colletotrichum orchidophilum TaxID=1209926 RepID=A0A1G4AP50_9PEZI|nr:uncharacterized protein CORC01_13877 [Colletotrichum orchidophilum]OHE90833.1 hypothetical protein CORC01_13877 [Colletotrichum orchidophilum]